MRPKSLRDLAKHRVPVLQQHIDKTTPCRMDDCTLYHALIDYLPEILGEGVRRIKSTDHGFTFIYEDTDGIARKYWAIYGSSTGKRIHRLDETYLETRSIAKARATMKPFTGEFWIEKSAAHTRAPMTEESKKTLKEQRRRKKIEGHRRRRSNRRGFSLAA